MRRSTSIPNFLRISADQLHRAKSPEVTESLEQQCRRSLELPRPSLHRKSKSRSGSQFKVISLKRKAPVSSEELEVVNSAEEYVNANLDLDLNSSANSAGSCGGIILQEDEGISGIEVPVVIVSEQPDGGRVVEVLARGSNGHLLPVDVAYVGCEESATELSMEESLSTSSDSNLSDSRVQEVDCSEPSAGPDIVDSTPVNSSDAVSCITSSSDITPSSSNQVSVRKPCVVSRPFIRRVYLLNRRQKGKHGTHGARKAIRSNVVSTATVEPLDERDSVTRIYPTENSSSPIAACASAPPIELPTFSEVASGIGRILLDSALEALTSSVAGGGQDISARGLASKVCVNSLKALQCTAVRGVVVGVLHKAAAVVRMRAQETLRQWCANVIRRHNDHQIFHKLLQHHNTGSTSSSSPSSSSSSSAATSTSTSTTTNTTTSSAGAPANADSSESKNSGNNKQRQVVLDTKAKRDMYYSVASRLALMAAQRAAQHPDQVFVVSVAVALAESLPRQQTRPRSETENQPPPQSQSQTQSARRRHD
ncbi:hypothetical protein Pelo_8459 [Pelomyxa schiedti]|nr:hypothetical protein Pelo_8459 [Pelomyxa schiedti]